MRKLTFTGIIAGSAIIGLTVGITGTLIVTHETAPREHVSTVTDTAPSTFCTDIAARVLDMASVMLTAWESGTTYREDFRTDNVDVYAEQLSANCQE